MRRSLTEKSSMSTALQTIFYSGDSDIDEERIYFSETETNRDEEYNNIPLLLLQLRVIELVT